MSARTERALADVLGGTYNGGWAFWRAALSTLELAIDDAGDSHDAFRVHAPHAFERLLLHVDDALRMAATAVAVQLILDDEEDGRDVDRRRDIAELLHARAVAIAHERNPLLPAA